jgi:hypothetical protein
VDVNLFQIIQEKILKVNGLVLEISILILRLLRWGEWGLGIRDWGLGIRDKGLGIRDWGIVR